MNHVEYRLIFQYSVDWNRPPDSVDLVGHSTHGTGRYILGTDFHCHMNLKHRCHIGNEHLARNLDTAFDDVDAVDVGVDIGLAGCNGDLYIQNCPRRADKAPFRFRRIHHDMTCPPLCCTIRYTLYIVW